MKKVLIFLMILLLPNSVTALSLSCRSCILMDMDSGRILYEKDINTSRLIASTTKIMTAILAIENGNLEDTILVGDEVNSMYGSSIYLKAGEKINLLDLLYGLILRSGNDAAVVIAKYIAGSEERFVSMMNEKAREIGMNDTIFSNPTGLDDNTKNTSTAYDMAILSKYAYNNSTYRKISSTKKYSVQTDEKFYSWTNRNKLLFEYKNLTGGKTGYTPSAGKTLVTTASLNGLNLTSVVLNDGNSYDSHKKMYEYGFENYRKYVILDRNKFKIDSNFYKEKIYIKKSFSYPLTEYEKDEVKVIVELNKNASGKKVGVVKVLLSGKEIYRDNVYRRLKKSKRIKWLF